MRHWQFSLLSFLLMLGALFLWLFLIIESSNSVGWGSSPGGLIMLIVLVLATFAVHHLIADRRNAWPLAAFLAGLIIMAALSLLFVIANN